MATIEVTCEALEQTMFSLKENDEISHISFRFDDNTSVKFLDDDFNPVMMAFTIDKADAILLAKSILLNYE
jgi:hypothetical protein